MAETGEAEASDGREQKQLYGFQASTAFTGHPSLPNGRSSDSPEAGQEAEKHIVSAREEAREQSLRQSEEGAVDLSASRPGRRGGCRSDATTQADEDSLGGSSFDSSSNDDRQDSPREGSSSDDQAEERPHPSYMEGYRHPHPDALRAGIPTTPVHLVYPGIGYVQVQMPVDLRGQPVAFLQPGGVPHGTPPPTSAASSMTMLEELRKRVHGGIELTKPPQPRKKARNVPDGEKDNSYWERRRKNNEAAKRSREARKAKEGEIAVRAVLLEEENIKLRSQVGELKQEMERLRALLYASSSGKGEK
ncbi:hepatic leukemia factor-like [Branchiostoma floridae]|uniref:Hepatic leukemia factor-like n=2 Tax=Branchiostoma floridae TaxID=7739 RepID=A0A9J7LHA0_BRAFL|nr:hepatic leukemia factor-like [Branchiostoma floridae]